jgi:hypothetical protein
MPSPADKLAESLDTLKSLQDEGLTAIRASQLSRTHRERLLRAGFLREVMKGWYIPARPDEPNAESTAWYASFWSFCADYLTERFGEEWTLSPEQSLKLHIGNWTVPKQLLVRSPKGGNKPVQLLYGSSIFDIRLELPRPEDTETKDGLRLINLPAALIGCAPDRFAGRPCDASGCIRRPAPPAQWRSQRRGRTAGWRVSQHRQ